MSLLKKIDELTQGWDINTKIEIDQIKELVVDETNTLRESINDCIDDLMNSDSDDHLVDGYYVAAYTNVIEMLDELIKE
jgi:hypothetical protein